MEVWNSGEEEGLTELEGSSDTMTALTTSNHLLLHHRAINDSNYTTTNNITYFPYYQHSLPVAASFILAYLFIFLLCMVGNVLVCLIVLGNRRMRTVTNLFILNLAVSDLLVGIFCIPTTLVDNLITGWPFTNSVCKMSGLVQGMSVAASVFTLVAIAVDRFRCIVYPFQPKLTLIVAKVTIAMIWVLAVVIMCPSAAALTVVEVADHYMVYNQDYNKTYPLYSCYENFADPKMRKVYTTVLFAHIYLVPLALITVMYGRIGVKLYTSVVSRREPQDAAHPPPRARHEGGRHLISQKKIKVIKMLIVVALLFMLSWLPLWTLMLLTDYAGLDEEQLELLTGYIFPFAHWLAFSNSSVNPIIYGYFNENFKRGFQAVYQTNSCCRPENRVEVAGRGNREGRAGGGGNGGEGGGGLREPTSNPNPLPFGARNKVYTDGNVMHSVHLELELKKNSKVGSNTVHVEVGGTGAGGGIGNGNGMNKKGLQVDEQTSPMGVCQAWDH
ncbi:neuropeptide FF receptor 1-like [Oncorhynchus keta]|uniref:neuropeptide FF receptor 1-like n=1 Tax=Oncorhynchus keta TaxID=8018 RepID=UPI0015F7D3FA|nr:neuropeptide FF receptor 1-like [Oncorhynchus keta]